MGMTYAEATTLLQAAGGPFETTFEQVLGRNVKVFKTRERSMREKVANAAVHGAKEFLIYEDRRITFTEFVDFGSYFGERNRIRIANNRHYNTAWDRYGETNIHFVQ